MEKSFDTPGDVREELEDARRQRADQEVGDALCHVGDDLVAELADAGHIRPHAVHHQ